MLSNKLNFRIFQHDGQAFRTSFSEDCAYMILFTVIELAELLSLCSFYITEQQIHI